MDINEIFEQCIPDELQPEVDGMHLIDIDLDGINESAKIDAISLIDNLSKLYYDEDFMKRNPTFKKRVDTDLESLRILFKMRKTDEEAHDILIKAIAGNSSNASLYKSLSEMQKTIISITTKICDIIEGLNNLMKGYQTELINKEEADELDEDDFDPTSTCRGTKLFIEQMNKSVKKMGGE
jgi:hypothetical protein